VTIYSVKGKIIDSRSNFKNLKIQAMDSDNQFLEDHNDDLLGSAWAKSDGSFEVTFDDLTFSENWIERSPEIYLLIRTDNGQLIHKTEILKIDNSKKNKEVVEIPITINLDSLEDITVPSNGSTDIYSNNGQRILSAFSSLGDVITLNTSNTVRNFQLLTSSINAWLIYTNELIWKRIGYDGPQVPRYPLKFPDHSHNLSWEQAK
jgi:hypothetical protein